MLGIRIPEKAFVFTNLGTSWNVVQLQTPTGSGNFGWSVSIVGTGDTVAVGGYDNATGCYIFNNKDGVWVPIAIKPTGSTSTFGYSLMLSQNSLPIVFLISMHKKYTFSLALS